MSDWRDYILKYFQSPSHRLTLVADPDGLMVEERLLATIHTNGFQLLRFDEPVQFRYAYESQFRQKWDRGEQTELVVVLRSPDHSLERLPYDLLESGRPLKFQLSDLFPKLSYPIVRELDRADLDALYTAYQNYHDAELGNDATRNFILTHVFGVALETLKNTTSVLEYLLARHYANRRVPETIDRLVLAKLKSVPGVSDWNLEILLRDRSAFFAFVQRAWPRFLNEKSALRHEAHETKMPYGPDAAQLPLDEPGIRAYIDSLFLEGYLKPVPASEDWADEEWIRVGLELQPEAQMQLRLQKLVERVNENLPAADAPHQTWLQFARLWAETFALRYRLSSESPLPSSLDFDALEARIEQRFAEWMLQRYLALHNYPPFPLPVMLHHIADYLSTLFRPDTQSRIALVVLDGLALHQWLVIQDTLRRDDKGWTFSENGVFAWVPTLTSVSRQSIFAGRPPIAFPGTWNTTAQERSHWKRFWSDAGLPDQAIGYFLLNDYEQPHAELEAWLNDSRSRVAGIVLKKVDDIMHGAELGMAGMQHDVEFWTERGDLAKLIQRLDRAGFTVYLTADHGNIMARGMGKPAQGALIEEYSRRALQFEHSAFIQQAQQQFPSAISWRSDALPENLYILLADDHHTFDSEGVQVVTHGGIALEEVIVPFVQVTGVPA